MNMLMFVVMFFIYSPVFGAGAGAGVTLDRDLVRVYSAVFKNSVTEPSDLYFDTDQNKLYTIDDKTPGHIFEIDPLGNVYNTYNVKGDMEGITGDKNNFYIVEEIERLVVQYDKKTLQRTVLFKLNIGKKENSGLEGITYNPIDNLFYIVNEKDPKVIMVISKSGKYVASYPINYFDDLSAISYDGINKCLWLLSDESKKLAKLDLFGSKLGVWKTNIEQAEGIAVKGNYIFIVSDPKNMIFTFKRP